MDWFSFDGRIGRQSFWLALIVLNGVSIVFWLLAAFMYWYANPPGQYVWSSAILLVGLCIVNVSAISFQARRWRDIGRSAWWCLINLVPLGALYAFVMLGFTQSVEPTVEVEAQEENESEKIDSNVSNPAIENLVETYRTLIWSHRKSEQRESHLLLVKEMRDNEVRFSRSLKTRLSGLSDTDASTGNSVDGSDSTLAQLISQFGTARATTLSMLRDGAADVWNRQLDDETSLESLVQNLIAKDQHYLEQLSHSANA